MLRRETTSRSQAQVLRQQATLWREPQDDLVQLNSRKINPQHFRKNNSHLYSNSKPADKELNPIWDDNGYLLKKTEKKSTFGLRRSASVASFHSNIYPNQKNENNTKKTHQYDNNSRYMDAENEPSQKFKRTMKQQQDSVIRLTAKKNHTREKSVQPRLLSTDFEGFIHRQTNCVKAHNKKPKPAPNYKIDISEGTKKLLQRSQKLSSHSIYDVRPKDNRDEDFESQNRSESSLSARPKIKKQEWRLATMNMEKEKELKEERLTILRAKIDAEEGRLDLSDEKPVKPKLNRRQDPRYYQDEPYVPQKYRPESIYQTRKRIESKINEMKPILEADQSEMNWTSQEKKNRKKAKNKEYLPDYMKTINDVIGPSRKEDNKK